MGRQMATLAQKWRRVLDRARSAGDSQRAEPITAQGHAGAIPLGDIAPDDPILHYFHGTTAAVDVDSFDFESPACSAFRLAGMKLLVPLVSQGELIGLLSLGPRLSDLNYSRDDRRLLENLAAQAAPAVRVAQLVRQQQSEVQARVGIEQELRVARVIQQYFLPKTAPDLLGWEVGAHYRPARAVGGDFYDFIPLPDGQLQREDAAGRARSHNTTRRRRSGRSVADGCGIRWPCPAGRRAKATATLSASGSIFRRNEANRSRRSACRVGKSGATMPGETD
jgi:hypothetical protein